jgi:hypothetical protein
MSSSQARMARVLHAAVLLTALTCSRPGPSHAGAYETALALGDRHYAAAHLADARTAYTEAVKAAPRLALPLRRLAITESELGETQKGDAQRLMWAEAVKHAREAARLEPDSASVHECLAIAIGRQALREGPRARLALSKEIKAEADRAIALDPTSARAWHVLAVWNMRVASLNAFERMAANAVLGGVPKGASHENALLAFQKAIELEPTVQLERPLQPACVVSERGLRRGPVGRGRGQESRVDVRAQRVVHHVRFEVVRAEVRIARQPAIRVEQSIGRVPPAQPDQRHEADGDPAQHQDPVSNRPAHRQPPRVVQGIRTE